jgi:phosphatidylserine/phosphatidylglycerophosphate/cardiolipin synthase-like enzyme
MKYRMLFVSAMIYLIAGNLSAQQANHVVISEVYGGGGNSGATLKNDFIELYNPTTSPISINGWSVQYASATGSWSASNITPLTGTIAPHGFFLIQEAQGTGGSINLPTPDAQGSIAMGASSGKVALVNSTTAITGKGDPSVIDFVGYGAANEFEGSTSGTSVLSNTKSAERKASSTSTNTTMESGGSEELAGNGYDSNNNAADFIIRTPQPQNSASPTEPKTTTVDIIPPWVVSMKSLSSTQIEIVFSEPLDSLASSTKSNYLISKNINVSQANRDVTNRGRVVLTTSLMANDTYTLTIQNIKDTAGNVMPTRVMAYSVGILTIAQARAIGAGLSMRVRGIITAGNNEFSGPPEYMQDSTGGLAIFSYNLTAKVGDIWEIGGTLKDYNGLLEIDPLTDSNKVSSSNPLPVPRQLNSTFLNESEESQLVRVNKVKFLAVGQFATLVDSTYAAGDAFGPLNVLISKGSNIAGSLIPSDSINLVGIVNEWNGVYRLLPRTLADINVIDPPSSQTWLDINIARSHPDGDMVKVRGVVTYGQPSNTSAKTIFLQDFSGGIAVYDSKSDTLRLGDSVEVKGVLKQFSSLLELSPIDSVRLLARGVPIPAPKIVTIAQTSEAYESQLIKIYGVRFTSSGAFSGGTAGTTYNITDGTNQLQVFIPYNSALAGNNIPGGLLDIVGIISQHSTYQLIPRTSADLIVYPGPQITSTPAITSVTDSSFTIYWPTYFPGNSVVYYGSTINLGDSVVNSVQTTSHSVTVSRLKSGRIYYYQVFSADSLGTAASFIAPQVTTSSASSGQMNVYFNYSIDATLGLAPLANGNADLLSKLLERISNTKNTIDMAVYSYDDFSGTAGIVSAHISDSLIAAHHRGVKIRVVFDNKTSTQMSRLEADGISVMKRSIPGIDGGIMHNKFFVFDGRDTTNATDDWVITGSWNVTNSGTLDDAQNAIFVQDQSLARIYTLEFEEMFGSSTETKNPAQAHFGAYKTDNTPHVTFIKGTKVESFFSPTDHTTSNIIRALSTADKDIFFGVMSFTRSDIAQLLNMKKSAGVNVRGIINDQSGSVLGTLLTGGVDVFIANHDTVKGIFHHKYGIVDPFNDNSDPLVITGSHNWSTNAETDNDENTVIIHSGAIARQYAQEFAKRYKESGGKGIIVGVENLKGTLPAQYTLTQNFPNPFNPTTNFQFQIPFASIVTIQVYDILGREVASLLNEMKPAGTYQVLWNASKLPSGVYFYQIHAGSFHEVKKAVLLK